nr:TIGR02281 family clan AA aspartic protease [uncultured Cohaesibacter sp.]
MVRLIFLALGAVLFFTMLPGLATDWLTSNGYMKASETSSALSASTSSEQTNSAAQSRQASARRIVLQAGAGGHFFAKAHFNNKVIHTVIDTGASFVALTHEDASRIGLRFTKSDYKVRVSTANGVVFYARARVPTIRIGQVSVRNVDILVAPKGALDVTLMGMSYLSKLKSFKMERGRMILEG